MSSPELPQYALEDELISSRSSGIQREIEADLKTLDEINFDSFLEEAEDLENEDEADKESSKHNSEEEDSVDEDNFFLENEESQRSSQSHSLPSGPLLQDCFLEVLEMDVVPSLMPRSQKFQVPLLGEEEKQLATISTEQILKEITEDPSWYNDEEEESYTEEKNDEHPSSFLSKTKENPLKQYLICPFALSVGCGYRTNRIKNLSRHLAALHKQLAQYEECCGIPFPTQAELYQHVKKKHSSKEFNSKESENHSLNFKHYSSLNRQVLLKHPSVGPSFSSKTDRPKDGFVSKKDFTCVICRRSYTARAMLEGHYLSVHNKSGSEIQGGIMPEEASIDLCESTNESKKL